MPAETRDELLERRFEQIRKSATQAIREEVEWLERHNFPVWISVDGRVVDATKRSAEKDDE